MIKRSKKTLARNRIIQKLDAAAREACFLRDELYARDEPSLQVGPVVCQRCYQGEMYPNPVFWCHVITRRDLTLRWELDNNLSLCQTCHEWFDNHKDKALAWFEEIWPERMAHIREIQRSHVKINLKQKLAELAA